ncbi:MAG: tetratricopeptide repeat protein [Rhodothermaceae bacterium]|nr:tetratricopeptide repeat protein [Rhodothermaceae bacterium]MXZ16953.1 tetratricopeptide repeat protein [Rhodothermaceae bacterium]MYC04925.1 tetratricopeptide repeat protein [Rhodothermaceae bacterium]MYG68473.1 tetratricopeptide repeat protein [Rhodothermaceae bacterium]MYI17237.1 tetratricopeptide repeat protein [Rhodothermaceae bacterium]
MTLTAIFEISLAMIQVIPGSGPKQHGRAGNDHLKQEQYEEAEVAYQEGLSSYQPSEGIDQTYYGLQNNLGLSLHRQENFEDASRAFEESLAHAPNADAVTRSAFNAGNNAFTRQQLERALEHYQTALLADPDNEDAKFNFEFVSRQLQQQQDQQQESGGDEQQEDEQNEDQEGEQNEEQNEDQQGEQEQEQQQEQNDQGQDDSEQPDQQDEQNQPRGAPLTREQAERILEALENEEEELLREVQKIEGRPRRVAKDW